MPFHSRRTWVIHPAESAEWLAEKLIGHSWCNCAGWSLGGYLFLNDQTSADGAFEVAIVKPAAEPGGQWWQVESITFGWIRNTLARTAQGQALDYINHAIEGKDDPDRPTSGAWRIPPCDVETPEQHGRCIHCA
jgi:hypothetical protein